MVSPAQKMWTCTVPEAKPSLLYKLQNVTDKGEGRREGIIFTISVRYNLIRYFLISKFVLLNYMILFSAYFVPDSI